MAPKAPYTWKPAAMRASLRAMGVNPARFHYTCRARATSETRSDPSLLAVPGSPHLSTGIAVFPSISSRAVRAGEFYVAAAGIPWDTRGALAGINMAAVNLERYLSRH